MSAPKEQISDAELLPMLSSDNQQQQTELSVLKTATISSRNDVSSPRQQLSAAELM